jgi:hypothetical protein
MNTMSSEFTQSIAIASPVNEVPDLILFVESRIPRLVGSFALSLRLGRPGTAYATPAYLYGALTFKESEVALLRAALSPGGELHERGIRARRNLFSALEVKAPGTAPNKTSVVVIESGQEIPQGTDWSLTRVSKDRFFEELGETLGGDGSPVEELAAPEPAI